MRDGELISRRVLEEWFRSLTSSLTSKVEWKPPFVAQVADPTLPALAGNETSVAGAIAFSGTVDAVDLFGEEYWSLGTGAPLFVAHGDEDHVNDVRNSEWIAERYNGSATLRLVSGEAHRLGGATFKRALEDAHAWLATTGLDLRPDVGAGRGEMDLGPDVGQPSTCGGFPPFCEEGPLCGARQLQVGASCYGITHAVLLALLGLAALALPASIARLRRRRGPSKLKPGPLAA